ncbi:MAG TPA: carboxypeptidase-like regulatory domain-containing protein [Longimicrobiaceae bacterium]|nr:carboxypeptidase-like regulatory domain-containing protein [Longimicrobiaceae bacterium]
MLRSLPLPVLLSCLLAGTAAAQRVAGEIVDGNSGYPIEATTVQVMDSSGMVAVGTTDLRGAFSIEVPVGDSLYLVTQRLGYAPLRSTRFVIEDGKTLTLAIRLRPVAVALDPLTVNARRSWQSRNRDGFERRREMAIFGRFLGPAELARRRVSGSPALLLSGLVPGLTTEGNQLVSIARGRHCTPSIVLDGTQMPDGTPLDALTTASDVRAIEVYQEAEWAPIEYLSRPSSCAVIVVWTSYSFGIELHAGETATRGAQRKE